MVFLYDVRMSMLSIVLEYTVRTSEVREEEEEKKKRAKYSAQDVSSYC
jgi:hypothetical protein